MNTESTIRRLAAEQASKDSRGLPKPATRRIKSSNELGEAYKPQGYGLYFCLHDKSYYEVCKTCRRTRRDAQRNLFDL